MIEPNEPGQKAVSLAQRAKVMTLATALDDLVWAAPVYYLFIRPHFYFFSNPSSRHIQGALASDRAACAIFEDGDTIHKIRGLQMTGNIEGVGSATRAVGVIGLYIKKFGVLKSLIKTDAPVGPDVFESDFNARLYRFSPQHSFYMDNRAGFGTRVEIEI